MQRLLLISLCLLALVFALDARERASTWKATRDKYVAGHPVCEACGTREKLEVHHVVPISQGGTDEPSNLITLCETDHFVFGHLHSWTAWNPDVREHAAIYRRWRNERKEPPCPSTSPSTTPRPSPRPGSASNWPATRTPRTATPAAGS